MKNPLFKTTAESYRYHRVIGGGDSNTVWAEDVSIAKARYSSRSSDSDGGLGFRVFRSSK